MGIDKKTEAMIFDIFAELKSARKTLLVISHNLGESLSYYDNCLFNNKQLIAFGSQQEVFTKTYIQDAYGYNLRWFAA